VARRTRPEPEWSADEIRRRTRRLILGLVGAAAIVASVFGGLGLYAGTWPPLLIIESGSMQHGDAASELGILDTGDVAVIQVLASRGVVITYLEGRASGYTSFGDYGDVVVAGFFDVDVNRTRALVHRAFGYVSHNGTGGFDVPELSALPAAAWSGIAWNGSLTTTPFGIRSFTLSGMGWRGDLTIEWNLTQLGAKYPNDGFLTFGDNNLYRRPTNKTDPWILDRQSVFARVRGEIPWIGLLRLTLTRSPDGCCASWGSMDPEVGAPGNSWIALDLLLAAAILGPIGVDAVFRRASATRKAAIWLIAAVRRSLPRVGRQGRTENPGSPSLSALPTQQIGTTPGGFDFETWCRSLDERIERLRGTSGRGRV